MIQTILQSNEVINLENNIKKLTKSLNINIVYNNQIKIFEVDKNNLQNIIKNNTIIEKEKTKQLELENENLKLKLELFKLSK